MEHPHIEEDSLEAEKFVPTPSDLDWGFSMSPPPLPLPHQQDSLEVERDVVAEAVKPQGVFQLPEFTCTPTDVDLVQDYLLPAIQHMPDEPTLFDLYFGPAVVNSDLPFMDPWELPGMIARSNKGGMRDNYYLTDHTALVWWYDTTFRQLHTPNGFWKKQTSDRVIRAGHNGVVGVKRTIKFHPSPSTGDDAVSGSDTNTNWIMNIYYYCLHGSVKHGLVLCHVFETHSTDYDDTPKCNKIGCHPGVCNGNHSGQAFGAPSNASFNSTHQASSWPMQHHDPDRHSDPMLNSYIAELGNILLGGPDDPDADTGNSSARGGVPPTADNGQSKKRKKCSDVWDYFTKIFAQDINGKVLTFAACNHCCKILSGNSKGGTTHLARHVCPCKFKPVEAGRNGKDSGGNVNVLSS